MSIDIGNLNKCSKLSLLLLDRLASISLCMLSGPVDLLLILTEADSNSFSMQSKFRWFGELFAI